MSYKCVSECVCVNMQVCMCKIVLVYVCCVGVLLITGLHYVTCQILLVSVARLLNNQLITSFLPTDATSL